MKLGFTNLGHGAVTDGATSRRRMRCPKRLCSHTRSGTTVYSGHSQMQAIFKIKVQFGLFDSRIALTPLAGNDVEGRPMSSTDTVFPLIVQQDAVRKALPHLDVRGALTRMFLSLANDSAAQPPQTFTPFPQGAGDFITYLGVMADAKVFGAKMSPYIVTESKPVITAWTALMSMETGQP